MHAGRRRLGAQKVLLSDVSALTFTRGAWTTGRRSAAVQQLQCSSTGRGGCPRRCEFQTALCTNQGKGDDGVPKWSCEAELPAAFELGRITVSCEGYESAIDPYILVGSCALIYTLKETGISSPIGYASSDSSWYVRASEGYGRGLTLGHVLFAGVILYFVIRAVRRCYERRALSDAPSAYQPVSTPYAVAVPVNESHTLNPSTSNSSGGHTLSQTDTEAPPPPPRAPPPNRLEDLPLPEGWEERIDGSTGRKFFVCHATQSTTWEDPRRARFADTQRQWAEYRAALQAWEVAQAHEQPQQQQQRQQPVAFVGAPRQTPLQTERSSPPVTSTAGAAFAGSFLGSLLRPRFGFGFGGFMRGMGGMGGMGGAHGGGGIVQHHHHHRRGGARGGGGGLRHASRAFGGTQNR